MWMAPPSDAAFRTINDKLAAKATARDDDNTWTGLGSRKHWMLRVLTTQFSPTPLTRDPPEEPVGSNGQGKGFHGVPAVR